MTRVLFVSTHDSARSQMAAAYLNAMAPGAFHAQSVGYEPVGVSRYAVRAMAEDGIDISANGVTDVFDLYRAGATFSYVITVCDQESRERCPVYPGFARRLHWSFPDPGRVEGNDAKQMAATRKTRDAIKKCIAQWLEEVDLELKQEHHNGEEFFAGR